MIGELIVIPPLSHIKWDSWLSNQATTQQRPSSYKLVVFKVYWGWHPAPSRTPLSPLIKATCKLNSFHTPRWCPLPIGRGCTSLYFDIPTVVPEEGWTTEQFRCHIVSSHDLFIGGNLALVIYLKYLSLGDS